jgi:hypothetical protein
MLMRRGAFAYQVADSDELVVIAGAAKEAADRARDAIDDALEFIAASNKRIESMEARHRKRASRERPDERHREGVGGAVLHDPRVIPYLGRSPLMVTRRPLRSCGQ